MVSKKLVPTEHEWDERRIDIIGQNGNSGEHYSELEESETIEEESPHPDGTVRKGKDPHPRDYCGQDR